MIRNPGELVWWTAFFIPLVVGGCSDDATSSASTGSSSSASTSSSSSSSVGSTSDATSSSTSTETSAGDTTSGGETGGDILPPDLTVLASAYPRSRPLRLAGDFVVWGSAGASNGGQGQILRTSIAGGEVETLVAGLDFPDDLLILEPWVYWADPVAGVVGRVGLDGSEPTTIASERSNVWVLVSDATHLYWIETGPDGKLARVPLVGGDVEELLTGLDQPSTLLLDGGSLFWIEGGATLELRTMPKDGGEVVALASTVGTSRSLRTDGDSLYWASSASGGGVFRAPAAGGQSEALVSPEIPSVWGLALDDAHLYWASPANHTLSLAGLQGEDPAVLVDGLMSPTNIALSETHIFFTDFEAGEVLRVGKPR